MPVFARNAGTTQGCIPFARNGSSWTGDTDQLFARYGGTNTLIYPDPAAAGDLLPVEDFAVSEGPDHHSVTLEWTNPEQPTIEPTNIQIRIAELGAIWTEFDVDTTTWTHNALSASTEYVGQIRYVRRVDGIATDYSPLRTVTFTTTAAPLGPPAPDPGGSGGDSIIPIGGGTGNPGSPGDTDSCWWEISVQQLQDNAAAWDDSALNTETSDDGATSIADEVAGDAGSWSVDFSSLTAGTIVRVCRREACDTTGNGTADTFGDWECGLPFPVPTDWDAECGGFTDSTSVDEVSASGDAVFRYPVFCKNSDTDEMVMLEETSGVELARGPGFYSFYVDDSGEHGVKAAPDATGAPWLIVGALTAVASMFVAEADWTVVSRFRATSDFSASEGRTSTIASFGGVVVISIAEGATGWTPTAAVTTSDGIKILTGDEITYDEAVTHSISVRWDDDGDLELFTGADSSDTEDVSSVDVYETDGLAAYNGAAAGIAVMQQLGWDRALTDEEISNYTRGTVLFTGGEVSYCGPDVIHTFINTGGAGQLVTALTPIGTLPPGGVDVRVLVVGAGRGWSTTTENSTGGFGGDVIEDTVNVTAAVTVKVANRWGKAAASPGNSEFGALVAVSGNANGNSAGANAASPSHPANYVNTGYGGGAGAGGDGGDAYDPGDGLGVLRGGIGGAGVYSDIPCTPAYFGMGGPGGGNNGSSNGTFPTREMEQAPGPTGSTQLGGIHNIAGGGTAATDESETQYGEGVPGGWVSDSSPDPSNYGDGGRGIVIVRY